MSQAQEGISVPPKPQGDAAYVTSWGASTSGQQPLRRKKEINWNYMFPMFAGSSLVLIRILGRKYFPKYYPYAFAGVLGYSLIHGAYTLSDSYDAARRPENYEKRS